MVSYAFVAGVLTGYHGVLILIVVDDGLVRYGFTG